MTCASNRDAVLVKAGRDRDRIGEVQAADILCKDGEVVGAFMGTQPGAQSAQSYGVAGLSREEAQRSAAELMKCAQVKMKLAQQPSQAKPQVEKVTTLRHHASRSAA